MQTIVYRFPGILELTLALEPSGPAPEDLFQLAVRKNPNRSFLFVSKVLGKHLPIHPSALLRAGELLASKLDGDPNGERTLLIGFAETATGLGMAAAAALGESCVSVSTTRLPLPGRTPLQFEEAHSHARTHLLYLDGMPFPMTDCQRVVIVDDEFTTGSTALRLVEALHRQYGIRRFSLLSLLDWSDPSRRQTLADQLHVEIDLHALLHGTILKEVRGDLPSMALDDFRTQDCPPIHWYPASSSDGFPMGRLPMTHPERIRLQENCRILAKQLSADGFAGADTLFLGSGECIYAPALIALGCGGTAYHSTTQSPVYPLAGSAIESGVCFDPIDRYSPVGYLYNVPQGKYRQAVIVAERAALPTDDCGLRQLASWLRTRGCERVEVVPL